jgi:hypothetical protein
LQIKAGGVIDEFVVFIGLHVFAVEILGLVIAHTNNLRLTTTRQRNLASGALHEFEPDAHNLLLLNVPAGPALDAVDYKQLICLTPISG